MTIKFEQLSSASGFMKHNGGLLFRTISEDQYEFKTIVTENHLNRVKITHGGYIASSNSCPTVSLSNVKR